MSADIITDVTFPHGTPEGFGRGCKTRHCPSPVSCRDVHVRYVSDWAYRSAVDAGVSPVEILGREAVEAERVRLVERDAVRAARAKPKPKPRPKRPVSDGNHDERFWAEVRRLNAEGLSDAEIGRRVGRTKNGVRYARDRMGLPVNRMRIRGRDRIRELHAQGLTDKEIAAELGTTRAILSNRRKRMGLTNNGGRKPSTRPLILALHEQGIGRAEIAARVGVGERFVYRAIHEATKVAA